MQFFRKSAIGAFAVAFARTVCNPQNVIGVAHLIQTPVNSPARRPNACALYQCGVPQARMQRAPTAACDYDRFQGLSERTCQLPCCCLQASPCTQDCELPETKLARKSRHVCPSCV